MVPYRDNGNLTPVQRQHNYLLSSDRVIIENAIGLLKERWRRLHFIKTYNICKTVEITSAACVLHNFCLLINDHWLHEENVQRDEHFESNNVNKNRDNREARLKRDRIANNFNQN